MRSAQQKRTKRPKTVRTVARRARTAPGQQALLELLEQWRSEPGPKDEPELAEIERALDRDRLSRRKLFLRDARTPMQCSRP